MVAGSAYSQRELNRACHELERSTQLIPAWLDAYNNLRFDLTTCSESRDAGLQLEDLFGKLDFIIVALVSRYHTQHPLRFHPSPTHTCRGRVGIRMERSEHRKLFVAAHVSGSYSYGCAITPLRQLTQSACT